MTKIGILGAGGIARKMTATLRGMAARGDQVHLYAVAAREQARAEAFAAQEGIEKAYGSYEAMLADPQVDLVYIATPHSHHAQQMELCIRHGKAVLCEKAFTANRAQAEQVLKLAAEKQVFVTEAIWTRYMPSRQIISQLLAEGAVGKPFALTANLGYAVAQKERIRLPELAGGALLDLGVYVLNFAAMTFGSEVERMESSVRMLETGVDGQETITLHYRDGRIADLLSTAMGRTHRQCCVFGDKGYLTVDNVNNPQLICVYDDPYALAPVRQVNVPPQITGYEYEVEACLKALETGALSCPEMPHEETLRIMGQMDDLRRSWNMRYPFE